MDKDIYMYVYMYVRIYLHIYAHIQLTPLKLRPASASLSLNTESNTSGAAASRSLYI